MMIKLLQTRTWIIQWINRSTRGHRWWTCRHRLCWREGFLNRCPSNNSRSSHLPAIFYPAKWPPWWKERREKASCAKKESRCSTSQSSTSHHATIALLKLSRSTIKWWASLLSHLLKAVSMAVSAPRASQHLQAPVISKVRLRLTTPHTNSCLSVRQKRICLTTFQCHRYPRLITSLSPISTQRWCRKKHMKIWLKMPKVPSKDCLRSAISMGKSAST